MTLFKGDRAHIWVSLPRWPLVLTLHDDTAFLLTTFPLSFLQDSVYNCWTPSLLSPSCHKLLKWGHVVSVTHTRTHTLSLSSLICFVSCVKPTPCMPIKLRFGWNKVNQNLHLWNQDKEKRRITWIRSHVYSDEAFEMYSNWCKSTPVFVWILFIWQVDCISKDKP